MMIFFEREVCMDDATELNLTAMSVFDSINGTVVSSDASPSGTIKREPRNSGDRTEFRLDANFDQGNSK